MHNTELAGKVNKQLYCEHCIIRTIFFSAGPTESVKIKTVVVRPSCLEHRKK